MHKHVHVHTHTHTRLMAVVHWYVCVSVFVHMQSVNRVLRGFKSVVGSCGEDDCRYDDGW